MQSANADLSKRLDTLPNADELEARRRLVVELQGDQQQLAKQVKQVLGQSRQQWRLAESEHLLRLAALRLSALQDIDSATELVQGADDILRVNNDPGAFAARAQLAKSLEALRALPRPDRTGLFLQLGALRDQAAQLQPLNPAFKPPRAAPARAPPGVMAAAPGTSGGNASLAMCASISTPARTSARCSPASNWTVCAWL